NNTFMEIDPASGQFDGATNIPTDTSDPALNGVPAGAFGEAVLNLTDTIGTISCGQFASVYMKERASFAIDSDLNDRTTKQPAAIGDCPESNLAKAVRNYPNGTFATTANAAPGDTLEYRLTYTNTGAIAATNVVVTDTLASHQTYAANSCTGCTVS